MKRVKKRLVLALTFFLFSTFVTPVFAQGFRDTRGHWAENSIVSLVQSGVIKGYPDGTFRPDGRITRAEFAALVVKSLKLQLKAPAIPSFTDVPAVNWSYPYVETAAAVGLIKGYEGKFWPNTPITREQIATMLVRTLNLGAQAEAEHNRPLPFRDAAGISDWARGYVAVAVELGMVRGYPDGTFRGGNFTTRAETCVLMIRFLQAFGAKTQDPPELTKAFYNGAKAELEITFDEEIRVNSADVTKIGFQFNNGNSVYFLTAGSKVLTTGSSSGSLTVKVVGMPNLKDVNTLHVWLKPAAVVDLDGVPNPLGKIAADFTKPAQTEQEQQDSPLPDLLTPITGKDGDLLEGILDTVLTPVESLLGGVLEPVGGLLDGVAGVIGSGGGLPLVGDVLGVLDDVAQPVTGVVGGVVGPVVQTVETLPVAGDLVKGVLDPLGEAVEDVPVVGDLVGALAGNRPEERDKTGENSQGGLLDPVLDIVGGLPLVGGVLDAADPLLGGVLELPLAGDLVGGLLGGS